MKERPMLFSAPMVRAILEGRKTQTRRVVKHPRGGLFDVVDGVPVAECVDGETRPIPCPYGQPGDRLWVRETWQYANWTEEGEPYIRYVADGAQELFDAGQITDDWFDRLEDIWAGLSTPENYVIDNRAADRRWRASIHMPRWASRILLEITDVCVQQLQDIIDQDAIAEGIDLFNGTAYNPGERHGRNAYATAVDAYGALWEQINGVGAWDANPWVWVLSFRRA